ncbi:hypothetical protein PHJA_000240100 [Phtheirospermum japonicum]|uniref:Uncharacterized protein n=1 Tax=Phtheirospermum japonicum TaxID=374723 RepID=A0A830B7G7_9LAMI|nr:hypothetical protein PHJA_000240100 [Phtheirospermum japonicum]
MAFMISKNQPSFCDEDERTSKDGPGSVTSHLFLKSSAQSLDKNVVLRRIRYHKTMSKVKHSFEALLAPRPANIDELYEEKWLQQGDNFTSP